ncbi:type II toxin-antitoxin system death-on-curing family toxin [Hoeflea sp.]|uniref:type II toxin-antitoxin system death-on-curing family toxin n=1 Tax=Hoeflea sp. TaxID=1940281 RepID=UPI0025B7CB1C|nr:type II toxin-antitoxin system death-on-curing family toxin [Hoeflea sp.]
MRYITLHEAIHVHDTLLKAHGGAAGIRDRGLVEAALLRPQTGYYADVLEEAAALWESLAINHGFVDGNKRIAFACMDIYLDLNGFELTAGEDETIRFIYHHLEQRSFTKDTLDAWLRVNTAPIA